MHLCGRSDQNIWHLGFGFLMRDELYINTHVYAYDILCLQPLPNSFCINYFLLILTSVLRNFA